MTLLSARMLLFSGAAFFLVPTATPLPQEGNAPKTAGQSARKEPSALPTANPAPSAQAPASSMVQATQPVISIHGFCDSKEGGTVPDASSCTTVVTREQFEQLMNSIDVEGRGFSSVARRNLAQTYVQLLAIERAARVAGLEDTQQFAELMRWLRLRTASELYRRKTREEFRTPNEEEVHSYYREHLALYDRITIARILVPRKPLTPQEDKDFNQKALEVAKTARDRAVKGEDPEKIQKDAYSSLRLTAAPPTDMGTLKRSDFLPEESEELFSLKAGDISKLEMEMTSYVIYKVKSREALPESKVAADIAHEISQQKFDAAIRAITEDVHPEYNESYFGPEGQPSSAAGSPPVSKPHPQ